ncbi:hypothetical protein K474DRAFT_1217850 [Panus rudis PR-1116 ss-1]|nr:hypothetical protein K474DRAFT_1217850 [Panus rudis PR-1116 ss-1]
MPNSTSPLPRSPIGGNAQTATSRPGNRRRAESRTEDRAVPPRHHSLYSSRPAPPTTPTNRAQTVDSALPSRANVPGLKTGSSSSSPKTMAPSGSSVIGSSAPNTARLGSQTSKGPLYTSPTSMTSRCPPVSASADSSSSALRRALNSEEPLHSSSSLSQPSASSHPSTSLRAQSASRIGPSSGKCSGASSDREIHGHLDFKRLMSKPAPPSHSGSSIISLPLDSEPSTSSSSPASRRPNPAPDASRPRKMSVADVTRTREPAHMKPLTDGSAPTRPLTKDSVSRLPSLLQSSPREPERDTPSKPRNVLRRKSSASNPTTPTAASFQVDSNNSNRSSSSRPTTRPSESRSVGHSSRRAQSQIADPVPVRGIRPREVSPPPKNLTPAGAVVHAYKQQEQRREQIAEMSGWNEQQDQTSHSLQKKASVPSIASSQEQEEPTSGPYYTVFGSEKVMTVGALDADWDFAAYYSGDERMRPVTSTVISAGSQTSSTTNTTGVRGLSRKMSGKFKKTVKRESSPHGRGESEGTTVPDRSWTPFDGRPGEKTLGRSSMEEYVRSRSPSRASSVDKTYSPSRAELDRERALRSSYKGNEKQRYSHREDDGSPGGKLWRLMKRISTGGLRDKYRGDTTPPPVPALPKDLQTPQASRMTLDIQKPRNGEGAGEPGVLLDRFMQSRTSLSRVRPSTAPMKSSPIEASTSNSRPSTGKNSSTPRPSTTTRSSSPISSDFASPRFHRTHSNRSSSTSYGEEIPPLPSPTALVAQHIVSPTELMKASGESSASPTSNPRKNARSRSVPIEDSGCISAEEPPRPSLPPPRRPATTSGQEQSRAREQTSPTSPPSPTIPAFNTSNTVNDFKLPNTLSISEFGVMSDDTPPRPRRSSRRYPAPLDMSTVSSVSVSSSSASTPRKSILPSLSLDIVHRTRKSISGSSSHRSSPRQGSSASSSHTSHNRSPLTFREIDSHRQQLSEKEKAEKWADLLERSDRAGGTLHLGETGLMSDKIDNVRFSAFGDL